ncbi:MAG: arylamine N-acetyltransferase [Lentisphaeria bacterium]|nr:arylamine N-acetyltransferase [Lentisphaeria bacterium]
MMTSQQLEAYLQLIGLPGLEGATPENLALLQRGQLEHIPYATLSLRTEKEFPSLETEALFERIVERRRGGYCFELNGLFAEVLRTLGYQVTEYFGRWHFGETDPVPMRRHRVLRVDCGGRAFIADAGIGGQGPVVPLELVCGQEQKRGERAYLLVRDPQLGIVVKTQTPEGFVPFYSFTEDPHFPQDFLYPHYYYSTVPESRFLQRFYMHRQTEFVQYFIRHPEAPETLRAFCIRENGVETHCERILCREQLHKILTCHFGVHCSPEELPD